VTLKQQLNNIVAGVPAVRQRMPEPSCVKRSTLLQAQAATRPGLEDAKRDEGGTHTNRAAVVVDVLPLPFIRAHPKTTPTDGGARANTIDVETLRHLVQEGKLAKATGLARMTHDAEVRGSPTTAVIEGAELADGGGQVPRATRRKPPLPRRPPTPELAVHPEATAFPLEHSCPR
jgi:hypothetical protein